MSYGIEDVRRVLDRTAAGVSAKKDELAELDGKSGDGDLGLSMEAAFGAMQRAAESYTGSDISALLISMAMECNKAAPSTMGTLMSAGVMSLAKACKGKAALTDADVALLPRTFAEGIMKRGKAKVGDKTILDALVPMADTAEETFSQGRSLQEAFSAAQETARSAAAATAGMQASIGRAKWLGERAAQYPDGGAVLCAVIASAFVNEI